MSEPTSTDRSLELVVEGNEKKVTGFIRGLFIGARNTDWPLFHDELGIATETFAEQLKGWVGLSEPLSHFVIDAKSLELVRSAIADPRCHGIKLRDIRPVLSASFDFQVKVFTPEAGAQVRAIFEKVPADVTVTGWEPKETQRSVEEHGGVELYTPVHHYKLEGSAEVSGPFRHVLYVHEQARRVQQIEEHKMKLTLGDSLV